QAAVPGAGTWKDLTDNVNSMAGNLTGQVRNIAAVTTAVANGDLSKKVTADVHGEILELKNTVNLMVDQLNAFAGEVTRVAREVGTEGKLGGQAAVPGAGTWKDLTDNVNSMAGNLTGQVRNIAEVATAIASGDLSKKITAEARGEILRLKETLNTMVDQLRAFAAEVTRVAREVGTEGRLGGQAVVSGVGGTWKDLTDNVNLLAANLTTQVRAIAEVATAVTKGDLTRSIQVETRGEVAELKDNINTMITNLRQSTQRGGEEDWLKTNLARISGLLQGQRELGTVGQLLLSELTPLVDAQRGVLYRVEQPRADRPAARLALVASYATESPAAAGMPASLQLGEGLAGQCALERRPLVLDDLPPGAAPIRSGLLEFAPRSLVVLPVLFESQVKAVLELASLRRFTPTHLSFLEQVTANIGTVLNSIEATMRTEALLKQSQELAGELQQQQDELQMTNDQLALKAHQLAERNSEVERKNEQIEYARRALEEKADELALTSKYKSEFLANMSHELRTPLNSILILGQQLSENTEGNLSPRQVEFARTIHGAGTDLLNLISDILDLSKIESGTVTVEVEPLPVGSLADTVERTFRHEAESRHLDFQVEVAPELAGRVLNTDAKRLMQVLKNLLSNAFKFTAQGHVNLRLFTADAGWSAGHPVLGHGGPVIGCAVRDTGIGIAPEKQKLVFEAFQQADAGTSRKYGGTGLGLAISRELSVLLGGELQLQSTPGAGSTFTLYLPANHAGSALPQPVNAPRRPLAVRRAPAAVERVEDDREQLAAGDATASLLIVEDEPAFARIMAELARAGGFRVLVAMTGAEGLELARRFRPTAISLDLFLPDMLGWGVLAQLKQDPATRHIPVQIVSLDEDRQQGLARGAFAFITKPATTAGLEQALERLKAFAGRERRRLLVVEDDAREQAGIQALLEHDDLEVVTASSGSEALARLRQEPFDCLVLDLNLPDMPGFDVLRQLAAEPALREVPAVVFTGRELGAEEEAVLRTLARSVVVKGVESPERLLDETALFLHRVVEHLPLSQQAMIERLHRSDLDLTGKAVLVVDDDVRNIFALSSVLERRGVEVLTATTGQEALDTLAQQPATALVLMDIMMPDMDGYETMRRIRQQAQWRRLPIVALTAKAMKGDREKCLDAGASEYLAKPVNTEQLLATLRTWLHR
ncbi:MAG: response regulator, partial [Terriglobales bacterium]